MQGYWFRTQRFRIEPGEDRPVCPGVYGRQFAHWLRDGLAGRGYPHAQVRQEDWGWCVIARQRPHLLWIGCGSVDDEPDDDASHGAHATPLARVARLWHCHAAMEPSWLAYWLDRAAADAALAHLDLVLRGLLLTEPDIQQVDPP